MIARQIRPALALAVAAATAAACQPAEPPPAAPPAARTAAPLPSTAPVVEVTAVDYAFRAPDEVPSGWTTFRMRNDGEEHHFLILHRLPEGRTFDEYVTEIGEPFNQVWYPLRSGEIGKAEAGERLGELIPAWFWSAKQMGGPGIVAPGGTSQATVKLEPGNYVMECYMKTPEGEFHAMEGMARPLIVTEASNGASPPAADVEMTLTTDGFVVRDELPPGRHTVAVHFAEQPEAGFGNDVHVARLDGVADATELVPWMDWMNVNGLENPAPTPFVGGTQEMPEGYTAYFTVNLEPGRYAWISESPDVRRMVREFTVR